MKASADPAEATSGALTEIPTSYPEPKPGRPKLNQRQRELRGDAMLIKRICGAKIEEIAKEFGLATATTGALLKEAERRSLITVARDKVLTLVPKAIAVVDTHLEEGDKDVGLEVLKGVGLLGRNNGGINVNLGSGTDGEETFEAWRLKISRKSEPPSPAPDGAAHREVIDLGPDDYQAAPPDSATS